jgi:hypothetical protein
MAVPGCPYLKAKREPAYRGWLVHKHRVESRGECRYPADYIYDRMGVVSPARALGSRKP